MAAPKYKSACRRGGTLGQGFGALVAVMDRRLNFIRWTPEAERRTGLDARQMLGRSLYEVFPEAPASTAETQYFEALRTGKPVTIATELDGTCHEITACLRNEVLCLFLSPFEARAPDAASPGGPAMHVVRKDNTG